MKSAGAYAQITNSVNSMVAGLSPEDAERALYMTARAALLHLAATKGAQCASEKAYALADELVQTGFR